MSAAVPNTVRDRCTLAYGPTCKYPTRTKQKGGQWDVENGKPLGQDALNDDQANYAALLIYSLEHSASVLLMIQFNIYICFA